MKIYIACPEPNDLKITKHILLSFYDIYISTIPFRKGTFKQIIKHEKTRPTQST